MTVNFQPEQLSRVFFDLGLWSGDMALDAGWSKSFPGLIEPKDKNFKFQSWLGVAAGARFGKKDSFAVGPVMAQEFRHERSPFIYFLRLIPMVRLSPSVGYELNAVIGAAFSF
ncbi:MAG: hypothetical protein HY747_07450 [Elusimicrobia bacterium]|nr:hypothetical protein [Elusimicrobiota bacterium]